MSQNMELLLAFRVYSKLREALPVPQQLQPLYAETTVSSVPFKTPNNLTFDANGNLFVADGGNARIDRITPAGVVTSPITGLTTPYQVTFDPAGNLYIGDLSSYPGKSVWALITR